MDEQENPWQQAGYQVGDKWRRAGGYLSRLAAPLLALGRGLAKVPVPRWLPSPQTLGMRGLIYSLEAFTLLLGVLLLTGSGVATIVADLYLSLLFVVLFVGIPVIILLCVQTRWQRRHSNSDPRRWVLLAPVAIFFMWYSVFLFPWYALFSIAASAFSSFMELLIMIGLAAVGIIAVVSIFRGHSPSVTKHTPDLLIDSRIKQRLLDITNQNGNGVLAGEIDGKPLYISTQDRACVIGPPGTGKTAFLVAQLLDWSKSGRSFVVNDIKPEIYGVVRERLEAEGYKLLTFNPTAQCGDRYNLLDDLESPEAVGELASALVPSDEAENTVFNESARDLLDALICHLRSAEGRVSLPMIRDFVTQFGSHKELLKELAVSPSQDARELANSLRMVANNERLIGSIFATFSANLRFLRFPAIREALAESDFTLADLLGGRVGLFLQFEESQQQTTARLFSVFMGHIMRYLIEHTNREPVLLLLDEIGNVPKVSGLVQKLNTIRSRELPTWLYWQSREQMQSYGQKSGEGANIITGACDLQAVFRLNDNATAEWFSDKIGSVDRLVEAISATISPHIISDYTYTTSQSLEREPVIFPHDLQRLAVSEVVCAYQGLAWRGEATPYFKRPDLSNVKPGEKRGGKYAVPGG